MSAVRTLRTLRTPAHVLYGGAHLYRAGTPAKLGQIARSSMETWGSDDTAFASSIGLSQPSVIGELARRVRAKLEGDAAVEKMCIDFEDGYGPRGDVEEDAEAVRAASELAVAAPGPVIGIRIKALTGLTKQRATRTLDLFLSTLAAATKGALPEGFTVTLPKVASADEVAMLADQLEALETKLGIAKGLLGIELMVETPRALVGSDGRIALPGLVAAARGRCVAAHLGAYDLTASLGVTAGSQRLDHPACDVARLMMQISLAGTGVEIVDGATTLLPTATNAEDVHRAWALHATNVTRALGLGIYQGWDLHPAQLPARYGAVYAFFLAERAAMAERLRAFIAKATQAMRSGQIFDDAATGQGLLLFFLRGIACGALVDEDIAATGLSLDELRSRSFEHILSDRIRPRSG